MAQQPLTVPYLPYEHLQAVAAEFLQRHNSAANVVGLWQLALELFKDGLSAEQSRELLQALRNTIDITMANKILTIY